MTLTRFQKNLLAVLAAMLLVSGALMAYFRAHPGVEFKGGLLKITEYEDRTVYSGKAQDTPVTITVSRPSNSLATVDFAIGEEIHDACEVAYPLEPIQTEFPDPVDGIRVTKNGAVLFEGAYDRESGCWFDAEGNLDFQSSGGYISIHGAHPNPWRNYETTAAGAARFAFGPETASRGDPLQFSAAVLLSIFLAIDILFHKELFRWRHWAAKDPDPSEEYLSFERVGWVIVAAIAAALYLGAMVEIY